ncbi:hypothetical protein ASE70_17390 [Sphingomonas sp. Leaf22]|uniref:hypothetical protein n=1 Tax=Sphingomonas sp. Leaf22 TaxID=1735687 RepID=UPI0006FFAA81|nr:hypothetical protein [Sphingomonas sp. Leaf22]KQM86883.1 hypothetical protein ASE70_17390 [Sphingomonas sp. Leaf22]
MIAGLAKLAIGIGVPTRIAKPVAIAVVVLAIGGAVWLAIALVYRSGRTAGGASARVAIGEQHRERTAEARADERLAADVTIAIADRTARADVLSETLLRSTIKDLRNALDATPPAVAGAAPPVVPVDRLRDDLNASIARANRAAETAAAP